MLAPRGFLLLALGYLLTACAPALSTLHPATIAPQKHVDGGAAYGVSVPVAGISRTVATARRTAERAEDGEELSEKDRDQLIATSLGLALNPPSLGSQYRDAYGIAPPRRTRGSVDLVLSTRPLTCPQCGSGDTEELSRFASTSCKSMWRCRTCREPFDHFKDH